jgi:hypothetical protein
MGDVISTLPRIVSQIRSVHPPDRDATRIMGFLLAVVRSCGRVGPGRM